MHRLRIVTPVYNDWVSLGLLLRDLDEVVATLPFLVDITAVDDGSTESYQSILNAVAGLKHLGDVEIVHLSVNVGHQRAIAVGLCLAVQDDDADATLIMDADGEDSPLAISRMMEGLGDRQDFCRVAQRRRRSENLTFRLSYLIYKFVFKLVTGKQINFGNFSVISRSYARRLVMVSDLWNNLPAAVLRSRLPFESIPVDRAKRYAGKSKMNFTSLVVHGLSGISVYAETIFVRLLLLTVGLFVLTAVSIAFVLTLRLFFPLHATPGWATTVSFGMVMILAQVLSVTLSSILMLLHNRVQRLVIPFADYKIYVASRLSLRGTRRAVATSLEFQNQNQIIAMERV
ncbi:glycosyltransferase family 2 protein [soil metagenome]